MATSPELLASQIAASLETLDVRRVLLYGYKTPHHMHHWIQVALMRAFEHLRGHGLPVDIRFEDNRSCLSMSELEHTLVLANLNVGHVDWALPINTSAYYVIHNHNPTALSEKRYATLKAHGRCMTFEVFRGFRYDESYAAIEGQPYHLLSTRDRNAVITWATDLLPDEIDLNKAQLAHEPRSPRRNVVFVGSIWRSNKREMAQVVDYCAHHGLRFEQYGDYVVRDFSRRTHPNAVLHPGPVDYRRNNALIRGAYLAPAIQGASQIANDDAVGNYIPCRIFKNISYGSYAATNNPSANDLLGGRLICSRDMDELMTRAQYSASDPESKTQLRSLMDTVRDEHTYLNRIQTLLHCATLCSGQSDTGKMHSWRLQLDNGARRRLAQVGRLVGRG